MQHSCNVYGVDNVSFSPSSLAVMFPNSKGMLLQLIKEKNKTISGLAAKRRAIVDFVNSAKGLTYAERQLAIEVQALVHADYWIELYQQDIAFYRKVLKHIDYNKQAKEGKAPWNDGKLDVERAKAVPISDFIKFGRAKTASCIWHSERTPSMHYYEKRNFVICFGCNRHGDVIDVVRQMYGLGFREAVQFLVKNHV